MVAMMCLIDADYTLVYRGWCCTNLLLQWMFDSTRNCTILSHNGRCHDNYLILRALEAQKHYPCKTQDVTHPNMLTIWWIQPRFVDTLSFISRSLAEPPYDVEIKHIVKKLSYCSFRTSWTRPKMRITRERFRMKDPFVKKECQRRSVKNLNLVCRGMWQLWYSILPHGSMRSILREWRFAIAKYCNTRVQFMIMFPETDVFKSIHLPLGGSARLPNTVLADQNHWRVSGYEKEHNQSPKALEWLTLLENGLHTHLQTCRSPAGEKYIGHLRVDGYDHTKEVYQFHGWLGVIVFPSKTK